MGVSSVFSILSNMMKHGSSAFSAGAQNFISAFSFNIESIVLRVIDFCANFFYSIVKWMLYVLDIIFAYVAELSGLNMNFESLDALIAPESDMVFNMLASSKEMVVPIVRNLVGLAIVIIIIFSIIALVKTQFESVEKSDPKGYKKVFVKMGKSFALLLLAPLMAIVGIIASDLILQALYQATNPGGSVSLSTQLFSTSASTANMYRIYANNGQRIPITYDFSKEKEIIEYYSDKPVTDTFIEYLQSSESVAYSTYAMFQKDDFKTFQSMNTQLYSSQKVKDEEKQYFNSYDISASAVNSTDNIAKYRRIDAYQVEYMVMADLVDYCVNTSNPVYFKTIEEVLTSMSLLTNESIFNSFVGMREISFCDAEGVRVLADGRTPIQIFKDRDWELICYRSDYYAPNEGGDAAFKTQIQYNHVKGATDEREGARFVVATERTGETVIDGNTVSMTYYEPVLKGYSSAAKGRDFTSDYIGKGQIIAAKGLFYNAKYPTAIKVAEDGSTVQFYREDVMQITLGQASDVGGVNFVPDSAESGAFDKLKRFFKTLFNPASLLPNLSFNNESMVIAYDSKMVTANELSNGKFHVSYMFSDALISNVIGSMYGLNLQNLYSPRKINYVILVVGAILMIKVTFKAVFALIQRAFELFLIIIIYPTACATLPLDEGGWQAWVRQYTIRLFSTYGLILGLNFVLLLFPVISEIEFFTVEELATNVPLRRLGGVLFDVISMNIVTKLLNLLIVLLFQLVAFTLIESVPKVVQSIIGGAPDSKDPLVPIKTSVQILYQAAKMIIIKDIAGGLLGIGKAVFDPEYRKIKMGEAKQKLQQFGQKAKGFVPGSAIVDAHKDKKHMIEKAKEQKSAKADLKNALTSGSASPKEIQDKFKALSDAQAANTKAIQNPTESRKAQEDKEKQDKKNGVSSREDYDDDENEIEYDDMTEDDLDEEESQANTYLKRLNKKEKSGSLSREEEDAKRIYEQKINNIQKERQKRKSRKDEYNRNKQEIDELDAKAKRNGGLSDADDQRYSDLVKKVQSYENEQSTLKKRSKDQKTRLKETKKEKEKEKAKVQQQKEEFEAFRHTDAKSMEKQAQILKRMDLDERSIDVQLKATGLTQDIEKMSAQEINTLVANRSTNGITDEQANLLKKYSSIRARKEYLVETSNKEYAAKAKVDSQMKRADDLELAGRIITPFKGLRRKIRDIQSSGVANDEDKLKLVESELESFGQVDASNIAQYQSLQAERQRLLTNIKTAENWNQMNTRAGRKDARAERIRNKREREQGSYLYEEAVERIEEEIQKKLNKAKTEKERKAIKTDYGYDEIQDMIKKIQAERNSKYKNRRRWR